MIIRRTILDQLELSNTGFVNARFALQLVEVVDGQEDKVLNQTYHRVVFDPTVANAVTLGMYEVNADLVNKGEEPVAQSEIDMMIAHVALQKTLNKQA